MKAKSLKKKLLVIKEICSWLTPGLDGRKVCSHAGFAVTSVMLTQINDGVDCRMLTSKRRTDKNGVDVCQSCQLKLICIVL